MVYRAYLSGWENESSQIVAVKTLKGTCGIGAGEVGRGETKMSRKAYMLENVVKQCSDL